MRIEKYLLKDGKKKGVVVIFPGGGYHMLSESEAGPVALRLNRMGLSAIVVYYAVEPARHPAPFLDATNAIREIRLHAEEYGIDPNRVAVMGFSAGGHLASMVATLADEGDPEAGEATARMSARPDAAVLCYPVITMGKYAHAGSRSNLIGEDATEDVRSRFSSENNVTEDTPPTFLWHCSDDTAVPVENSLMFAGALSAKGVPFELHVFPKGGHGGGICDTKPYLAAWVTLCEEWLRRLGFMG